MDEESISLSERRERATVVVTHVPGAIVVTGFGEIDMVTAPELRSSLREAIGAADGRRVVLDLRSVEFLASAGCAALAEGHNLASRQGGLLHVVVAPDGMVCRVLALVGLARVVRVHSTLDAALQL